MVTGFELCIELTFPSEESTAGGILFSMSQILGVLFTVFAGHLNLAFGCYWSLMSQAAFLVLGTVITAFIPNTLKRQAAFNNTDPINTGSGHG